MAQIEVGGVCALGRPGDVCLDAPVYERIIETVEVGGAAHPKNRDAKRAVSRDSGASLGGVGGASPGGELAALAEVAREKTGCADDACVLAHPVSREALGAAAVRQLERERLKVVGPATSTKLLDNFNIDHNVWQWMRADPTFQGVGFAMIDFDAYPLPLAGDFPGLVRLRDYDPVRALAAGRTCAGCVINSDRHTGGGIHWMALFVDMRPADVWTVSFFNSSGRPPVSEIVRWQRRMCDRLAPAAAQRGATVEDAAVCEIEHQMGNTECGPYSLYYIWSRLSGVPDAEFRARRISDEEMHKFRRSLFRAQLR